MIKNQWLELLDKASAYLIHYTRKQNQLYPILEKKGFDRPTVTMWTFDDMISNSVKKLRPLLESLHHFFAKRYRCIFYSPFFCRL